MWMFKYIIPPLLVTLFFGLYPWGIVASIIVLAWYAFWTVFFPSNRFFNSNLSIASQAALIGNHRLAFDHVNIALREVNRNQKNFDSNDIEKLISLTNSIENSGALHQSELAHIKEELISLRTIIS